MNPDQLWETTLNPETRTLIQVTIDDAAKAEKMVSLLMGDIVEPRKNYMYKYAEFQIGDEINMAKKQIIIPKDNNIIRLPLEEVMPDNYLPYAVD